MMIFDITKEIDSLLLSQMTNRISDIFHCISNILQFAILFVLDYLILMSFVFHHQNSKQSFKDTQYSKPDLFKLKQPQIKCAKTNSSIYWKIFIFSLLKNLMNLLCFVLTFFVQEFNTENQQFWMNKLHIYHLLMLFAILSAIFNIFMSIPQKLLQSKSQFNQPIMNSNNKVVIILSTIFYLSHPSKYASSLLIDSIKFNKLMAFLVYLRIIPMTIFLIKLTNYYGLRVDRVLNFYGKLNQFLHLLFTIKSLCKLKPFTFILSFLAISITLSSLLQSLSDHIERVYLSFISMTTVGYGDIFPVQSVDRFLIIAVIIIGSFISSMLTLTFLENFQLNDKEAKSLEIIKRLQYREQFAMQTKERLKECILIKLNKIQKEQKVKQQNMSKDFLKNLSDHRPSLSDFYSTNYLLFKKSLEKLVEKQIIISNLLVFLLERLNKKVYRNENKQTRRVQDSIQIYSLKNKIINGEFDS